MSVKRVVTIPYTCFSVIDGSSSYTQLRTYCGLLHSVHVAVQNCKLQCGELQCFNQCVVFCIIRLFLFKAVYGIHRQCLVIGKVYVFDDSVSVGSVTQAVYKSVYFTIAGTFYCNLFTISIFAVNSGYLSSCKLPKETTRRLSNVVSVRYGIAYFVHMVQVFVEADIQSVCHFHVALFLRYEVLTMQSFRP